MFSAVEDVWKPFARDGRLYYFFGPGGMDSLRSNIQASPRRLFILPESHTVSIDRSELERLLADRPAGSRSAMQAVRESYGDIGLMRERGLSWAEISDLLATLGITTRDSQPISPVTLRSAFFLVGNEGRGDQAGDPARPAAATPAETLAAVHEAALSAGTKEEMEGEEEAGAGMAGSPDNQDVNQDDPPPEAPAAEPATAAASAAEPIATDLPEAIPPADDEAPAATDPDDMVEEAPAAEAPAPAERPEVQRHEAAVDSPVPEASDGTQVAADQEPPPHHEAPKPASPAPNLLAPALDPAAESVAIPVADDPVLDPVTGDSPSAGPLAEEAPAADNAGRSSESTPKPEPASAAVAQSTRSLASPDKMSHDKPTNVHWKGDRMLGTIFVLNDRGGVGKTLLSHHLMATAMLEGLQLKVVEYEVNERLARLFGPDVVEHRRITQDFMNMMGSADGFYEFWDLIGPELQRGGRLFDFGGNISQWFFNWAEVSGFDYYVGDGERLTFMVPVTVDLASLSTGMTTLERVATIAPKAKRVLVENGFSGPFSQLEDSQYARRKAEMVEREGLQVISMPPCTAPAWARLTGHRLDQVATMTREDLVKLGMTPPVASRSLIIIHEWLRNMRQALSPYLHDAFRQTPAATKGR